MAKSRTYRFGAGDDSQPYSGVWRLVVTDTDVYLGASKTSMGTVKVSLHQSGVWVFAATQQSGATFQNGNRRAKQWAAPAEHSPGVGRGPSVLVPHTFLGARAIAPDEGGRKVIWFPAPVPGSTVEFSLYFVAKATATSWAPDERVLVAHRRGNGAHVVLLGSSRPSAPTFLSAAERLLRENVFKIDAPSAVLGGSFLWITQSTDASRVPVLVDMPVPIGGLNIE